MLISLARSRAPERPVLVGDVDSLLRSLARPSAAARRYVLARMVIIIVVAWALLGLGTFFVAMRGGRSKIAQPGARQALQTDRSEIGQQASRRLVTLGVVALVVFGL